MTRSSMSKQTPSSAQIRPVSATLNQIRYWKQIQSATESFAKHNQSSQSTVASLKASLNKLRKGHNLSSLAGFLDKSEKSLQVILERSRKGLKTPSYGQKNNA